VGLAYSETPFNTALCTISVLLFNHYKVLVRLYTDRIEVLVPAASHLKWISVQRLASRSEEAVASRMSLHTAVFRLI